MFDFQKQLNARLKQQYGTDPTQDAWAYQRRDRLNLIRIYHEECGESPVDDITWADLEMDDVFLRINHTRSYVGEQVLYRRLHETDEDEDWERFESVVAFLDENEAQRLRLEQHLCNIGKMQASFYLPSTLRYAADYELGNTLFCRILQLVLFAFLAAALLLPGYWYVGLIVVACVNLTVYSVLKAKHEKMIFCFSSLSGILKLCEAATDGKLLPRGLISEKTVLAMRELRGLRRTAGGYASRKAAAQNDPRSLLMDYLFGITLWDIVAFNRILAQLKGHEDAVMRLYRFAGQIDLWISVASFRRSIGQFCTPQFADAGSPIEAAGLYHPLLASAVKNDISLRRYSLITGANASGKSTFMKALAVNVLLAQTIHTCAADSFQTPPLAVMTSMALRDDVISGESYYVREVRYLKRILDVIDSGLPVFCVIDEILKGTNAAERIAASEAVLRYLLEKPNCTIIVATHDMELVKNMGNAYDRFHFNSVLMDAQIYFDYKIRNGAGGGSNAIALLGCFHFPEEIVKNAEQYAAGNSLRAGAHNPI